MEQGRRRGAASRAWATLAALLLGLLVPLLTATGAQAHAVLRSISPTHGAQLTKAPTQVVLTFDEAVSTSFATVAVTDGSGASVSSGKAQVDGSKVIQPLKADLSSGKYTVAYRVVSDDGHPVSDKTTFTLTVPASTTPSSSPSATPLASPTSEATAAANPAPKTQSATTPTGSDTGGGLPAWAWIVIAAVILVAAAGTAAVLGRRRQQQP